VTKSSSTSFNLLRAHRIFAKPGKKKKKKEKKPQARWPRALVQVSTFHELNESLQYQKKKNTESKNHMQGDQEL